LDRGSARRKAATYTQNNTNRITHTDIHASSGIRIRGPSVREGEDHAATVIGHGCRVGAEIREVYYVGLSMLEETTT
jgi:hypothetical protein